MPKIAHEKDKVALWHFVIDGHFGNVVVKDGRH